MRRFGVRHSQKKMIGSEQAKEPEACLRSLLTPRIKLDSRSSTVAAGASGRSEPQQAIP
jgi:hypothetical protein